MKKTGLFKHTALVCALILTLLLVACGSKSPSDLIVGRWVFEENTTTGFEFFSDGEAIGSTETTLIMPTGASPKILLNLPILMVMKCC